ncbi:type IX secretion system membrane protein PorP/SprF [Fluviicola sp.]|uniref:PorP/SprF family type IX secretion system membrane protein n=1 Tax=Fluviicola sp. TaxID=1917219 RepID=UPI002606C485|nr:type IX secretion system membrane protein PorP/SprF [Fluviicola sp.]
MNKKHFITGLFVVLLFVSFGQQQSIFTNILANPLHYSPAYVGSTNYHEVSFFNRTQWVGFKDAPRNFYLNFHGSFKNKAKHGYGVQLLSEQTGLLSKTGIYVNYGYQIKMSKKWKMGLGVRPGFVQYRIRLYDAVVADAGDPIFTGNTYSGNAFDVNAGFRLYSDKFEFSGGIDHLIGKNLNLSSYNQNLQFHYTLMTSYKFQFKKNWELRPAILFRYTKPVPSQLSILAQLSYKEKFFGGLNFRTNDAIGIFLGIRLKNRLSITYGYDYSYTKIRKYGAGSHEVGISFIITKNRPSLEEEDDKLNNSILEDIQKEIEKDK